MNKVVLALCLFAAVAFAGTVSPSCSIAVDIELNAHYEGDTTYADYSSIQCGTYKYSARGIWYHLRGTGGAVILDTCDQRTAFDSVIFVFDSCQEDDEGYITSCVAMDDDGCMQRQSRVMFTAESLHDYHVFVTGFLNASGIFYLGTSEVLPPSNYKCNEAVVVPNSVEQFSVEGQTGTCLAVRDVCQNSFSSGLWYKVEGTGGSFIAHTCNQNTNFDTVIGVFGECSGEGDADGCVAWNNDGCYRSSLVSWRTVQNTPYYVFVTGFNNARGRFTLAIEKRSMNPYGYCYEPLVITALPFYYSGQTDYLEPTYSECRDEDNQHSLYFRMQGGNRNIIATTCTSSSTVNDSVIDVYTECEPKDSTTHPGSGHYCVASNDDYCGLGAQVVFFATANTYYIVVSSVSSSINGVYFSLSVMPYEETANTQCWFAEEVDQVPDVFTGNTTHVESCTQSCDGSKTPRRGGWYRYTHYGDKKTFTASTCGTTFNTIPVKLEVYNDCNEMSCVAQGSPNEQCTTVSFDAENGKTYNIFVTANDPNSAGGYYHVDFYEQEPNAHGTCDEAYFVQRGSLPYRLEDNTITVQENSYSDCSNKSKRGIWVNVIGTGTKLVATTCDSHTGFDTVLELYDHCPEEEPHPEYCLDINDDSPSCNRASEIEWASVSGAYYWIFVTGFSSNAGVFALKIYQKSSMINAWCSTAVGIRSLPYYDYGLTTYCMPSNASCGTQPRKGNWYELVGNDHWVTVSTCRSETDFATEVEVYLACSKSGGEICVNHNHDYKCAPKTEITFAAIKDQLFYIFVTGVEGGVMSEGFFGMNVTMGDKLPSHLSSESGEGLSGGEKFLIAVGSFMGLGLICAVAAVCYGLFKRRHVSYQEISTAE